MDLDFLNKECVKVMAISSWKRNIRLGLVILGAGLICTYLYTRAMENAPTVTVVKRNTEIINRLKVEESTVSVNVNISEGECRWIKPWFNRPVSSFERTQMIFFGKPFMQSLKNIATERHWGLGLILNDSTSGLSRLHNYLSVHDSFTIVITSSRFYKYFALQNLSQSKNALVSAVRYAFKITGGKKGQLVAFREHFLKYGCNLDDLEVMPRSFLLDSTKECLQFFKYADKNPDNWWVLKESSGYGGTGITIHSNLTKLYKDFSLCTNTKEYVVQKYLPSPLLLHKRKFDIRGLVLIASTQPYLLFHHNGYLRVSMKQFSPQGGKEAHITNSHLQVNAKNYSPDEHLWSFERFQSYLDEYVPENNDFVRSRLVPFIKKTALFILQTGVYMYVCHRRSEFLSFRSCYFRGEHYHRLNY